MARSKVISESALEITSAVTSTVYEIILAQIKFGVAIPNVRTSASVWRAYGESFEIGEDDSEWEGIDVLTLKRALYLLKSRGLINVVKEEFKVKWEITESGLRRLDSVIPVYDEKRVWDGRIYLITYDIPEERKGDREVLRKYLYKLGAGQLQLSVYLTPYNPKGALKKFIRENELKAQVIISDVGEDGSVGDKSLRQLVKELYSLGELNSSYRHFVRKWKGEKKLSNTAKTRLAFEFISILKEDPQIPFDVLPTNWQGTNAYKIYKKHILESSYES